MAPSPTSSTSTQNQAAFLARLLELRRIQKEEEQKRAAQAAEAAKAAQAAAATLAPRTNPAGFGKVDPSKVAQLSPPAGQAYSGEQLGAYRTAVAAVAAQSPTADPKAASKVVEGLASTNPAVAQASRTAVVSALHQQLVGRPPTAEELSAYSAAAASVVTDYAQGAVQAVELLAYEMAADPQAQAPAWLPEDLQRVDGHGPGEESGDVAAAGGAAPAGLEGAPEGEEAQYDYYAQIISQNGQLNDSPEARNLLGFRTDTNTHVNGGHGEYDDTVVMIWKDSAGQKHVRSYEANTEPQGTTEDTSYADDTWGNGSVGRLPTGYFEYKAGYSDNLGNCLRMQGTYATEVDYDKNGLFDDGKMGDTNDMQFHAGGTSSVSSAGCQTMRPEVFNQFWSDLGGYEGTVGYTLVKKDGSTQPLEGATASGASASTTMGKGVSAEQLQQIMPNAPAETIQQYLPLLNAAMQEGEINTPERVAGFLSQLAVESGEFKYMEEIADGSAYEGRGDLGNDQPGDGMRFKGRGPIQLTGRANYRAAGAALGLDLEGNPEQAASPEVGFRTAVWYWTTHNMNDLADAKNIVGMSGAVNAGNANADPSIIQGLSERQSYYQTAMQVLGGGLVDAPIATGDYRATVAPMGGGGGGGGSYASGGGAVNAGYGGGGGSSPSYADSSASSTQPVTSDAGAPMQSYGQLYGSKYDLNADMLDAMLEELYANSRLMASVVFDPDFAAWIVKQPGMSNWKPGQPVPKEFKKEFLAMKLAQKAAEAKEDAGEAEAEGEEVASADGAAEEISLDLDAGADAGDQGLIDQAQAQLLQGYLGERRTQPLSDFQRPIRV